MTPYHLNPTKRGIIMVFTLLIMPICVIMGAIMIKTLISERYFLQNEKSIGQSFYMAEIGLNVAYSAYVRAQVETSSVEAYTHLKASTDGPNDSGAVIPTGYLTLPTQVTAAIPFQRVASGPYQGWYEYKWTPGDAHESLTGTGLKELIRFRVSRMQVGQNQRNTSWEIVSEAEFAGLKKTHRQTGMLEGFLDFAELGKGDINEHIRGADQFITGKVHANGNIYLRPESGRTLTFRTDSMTATGKFVYGKDAVGRSSSGFTVKASKTNQNGSLVTWPVGFNSDSSNWHDPRTGVLALFDGTVRDGATGATPKSMPPVASFEPGGFYYQNAQSGGLLISKSSTGQVQVNGVPLASSPLGPSGKKVISAVTVRNHLEGRNVTMYQIDFDQKESAARPAGQQLAASDYGNGLIYSEFPVVITNGAKLPRKTTIVSQSTIMTKGDFNKEQATSDDLNLWTNGGTVGGNYYPPRTWTSKQSAALITKDRIFHVSKGFNLTTTVPLKAAPTEGEEYAGDNRHVNRDNGQTTTNVIEINAALIDGAPLHDEIENRVVNPAYPDPNDPNVLATKPKYDYTMSTTMATSWDDFLEDLGGTPKVVVKKRGSIVHMDNATLPNSLSVTNPPLGVLAWHRSYSSHYSAPVRDYGYDETLKKDPPPFQPVAATKLLWQDR